MSRPLRESNPYLRDPVTRRRLLVAAIAATQRQEGNDITDARAEQVYGIVFEGRTLPPEPTGSKGY